MKTQEPPTAAPSVLADLRILVVDDDEVDRLRVQRTLRQVPEWRVKVDVAVDLASGIQAARQIPYNCVLLDFHLPDGDAPQFLAAFPHGGEDAPPIIIQTVLDHETTALNALAGGAQDYLVKGRFDAVTLRRSIHYAMQRHSWLSERNRLVRELQSALAKVRTLEGLLPTCAWCNSIRSSSGAWMSFESYIKEHTDATCSHGICPSCAKKCLTDQGKKT